ncbi:Neuropilin-1a [Bagarius yarrelli]|uniref:Neuropilin-1a n=1 Tax=Bagarius yarrelli TaxID=175774 RepID=A0A556VBI4_BAGYA|nr:Neuropilin-1a [Bagarius yarrelli]
MTVRGNNNSKFGYVECGPCIGDKQKAIKSCLVCLDSYCPTHFELHEELHSGQHHKIMNASGFLDDKICSRHNKLLEVFCCLDQQCICFMCTMDDHKGHTIASALEERTQKQSQLGEAKMKSQRRITEKTNELWKLQKAVDTHKRFAFLTASLGSSYLPNISISSTLCFKEVTKSVSELKKHMEDFCRDDLEKIEKSDYCELTMDPNTAYKRLSLSQSTERCPTMTRTCHTQIIQIGSTGPKCCVSSLCVDCVIGRWNGVAEMVLTLLFPIKAFVGKVGTTSAGLAAVISPGDSTCGGNITVTGAGYLTSPGYPLGYLPSQVCVWLISSPDQHQRIFINFNPHFDIENRECKYDFLEVYDGQTETACLLGKFCVGLHIGRYCGSSGPGQVTSYTGILSLSIYTDSAITKEGFSSKYRIQSHQEPSHQQAS